MPKIFAFLLFCLNLVGADIQGQHYPSSIESIKNYVLTRWSDMDKTHAPVSIPIDMEKSLKSDFTWKSMFAHRWHSVYRTIKAEPVDNVKLQVVMTETWVLDRIPASGNQKNRLVRYEETFVFQRRDKLDQVPGAVPRRDADGQWIVPRRPEKALTQIPHDYLLIGYTRKDITKAEKESFKSYYDSKIAAVRDTNRPREARVMDAFRVLIMATPTAPSKESLEMLTVLNELGVVPGGNHHRKITRVTADQADRLLHYYELTDAQKELLHAYRDAAIPMPKAEAGE